MDAWLYIALLGAAIWVYASLLPKRTGPAAPSEVMKEIEDTIDHFSSEMEEENRQMMKLVTNLKHDHEAQVRTLQNRIEFLERQSRGLSEQVSEIAKAKPAAPAPEMPPPAPAAEPGTPDGAANAARTGKKPDEPAANPAASIRIRYAELFRLQGEGKSTEFIAKKLGMNKGEVMLIMQLGKQEDLARA